MNKVFLNILFFMVFVSSTIGLNNAQAGGSSNFGSFEPNRVKFIISNQLGNQVGNSPIIYFLNGQGFALENGYERKHEYSQAVKFEFDAQRDGRGFMTEYIIHNRYIPSDQVLVLTFRVSRAGNSINLYRPDNRTESEKAVGAQTIGGGEIPIFEDQ